MPERLSRSEGFAGQRLVVLPERERAAARRHPLLQGLHVTDAGYFPAAAGHLVERRSGALTTLLMLCLQGRGEVGCSAGTLTVQAGDCVWLPAQEPHRYGADATEPWTLAWVHFAGEESGAWRDLILGSSANPLLALPRDRADEIDFGPVEAALEQGFALRQQVAAATALRQALTGLAALAMAPRQVRSAGERVLASIERLRRDFLRLHRLEDLAAQAGVSVTHYSALFRRHTGYAPIDFVIRLRVRQACRLLDTTDLAVGAVAERVGYADAYYFARIFRRVMGCAPRVYRSIPKG